MLIPCDEVNILNTFRVMIILRLLLLLTNLHLKLLSTQGTGADKLLSTERVNASNAKRLLDVVRIRMHLLFVYARLIHGLTHIHTRASYRTNK